MTQDTQSAIRTLLREVGDPAHAVRLLLKEATEQRAELTVRLGRLEEEAKTARDTAAEAEHKLLRMHRGVENLRSILIRDAEADLAVAIADLYRFTCEIIGYPENQYWYHPPQEPSQPAKQ